MLWRAGLPCVGLRSSPIMNTPDLSDAPNGPFGSAARSNAGQACSPQQACMPNQTCMPQQPCMPNQTCSLHAGRSQQIPRRSRKITAISNCAYRYKFFVLQKTPTNHTGSRIWPRLMTDGSVPKQKPRKKSKLYNSAAGQVFKGDERRQFSRMPVHPLFFRNVCNWHTPCQFVQCLCAWPQDVANRSRWQRAISRPNM